MDELEGGSARCPDFGAGPGRFGREEGQRGTDPFAALDVRRVTAGVRPTEVVAHHVTNPRCQAVHGLLHQGLSQNLVPVRAHRQPQWLASHGLL